MRYTKYVFGCIPAMSDAADVLSALLADCGFETFEPCVDGGLVAYIQTDDIDESRISQSVHDVEDMFGVRYDIYSQNIADENWNAKWEKEGFAPIVVDNRLVVRSTEHSVVESFEYDIKINPCMAFGTGSHDTTRLLLAWLLDNDVRGINVVDAGCGTGVLGIFAMVRGASELFAYDIDEWSVRNTESNCKMNCIEAQVAHGDADILVGRKCDLLIANINRNILLNDMPRFADTLNKGGRLLLSGFYSDDAGRLKDRAVECGLECDSVISSAAQWTMMQLHKPA